jgi:hypothetical protein
MEMAHAGESLAGHGVQALTAKNRSMLCAEKSAIASVYHYQIVI